MAHPYEPRTTEGYTREIQHLSRLRGALVVDTRLNTDDRRDALNHIDHLVDLLTTFRRDVDTAEV